MRGPFQQRTGEGVEVSGPALGFVEVASLARGWVVVDQMVKKAPVTLALARPISSGKHVTLITGGVADVNEAMAAGLIAAGERLVDKLELALAADELLAALGRRPAEVTGESAFGFFETSTCAASLLAADAACKAAAVRLGELHLGDGIGGKAYFFLLGEQGDVEAGLLAGQLAISPDLMLGRELIARPHDDLVASLRR
jgi:microcompartment protein CcmL/EutN